MKGKIIVYPQGFILISLTSAEMDISFVALLLVSERLSKRVGTSLLRCSGVSEYGVACSEVLDK